MIERVTGVIPRALTKATFYGRPITPDSEPSTEGHAE